MLETDWIDQEEDGLGTADSEMTIWGGDKTYVAKDAIPLWGEVEPGLFAPFYSSGPRLPAATYSCVMRHDHGICLQKVESSNDELLLLPDRVSTELIDEARRFWAAKEEFRKRGFLHKRGFLLIGPAGSGKTSIINQVSEYVLKDLKGLVVLVADPARAEQALAALRRVEPERAVLVVIEDIDAMLGEGQEERLLSFLDGKTQIDHVLFIATTNYPERLDQRLRARPSRFDRVQVMAAPSLEVRRAYLEQRLPDLPSAQLDLWVELSAGFTIAHLKELILAVQCLGADLMQTAERLRTSLTEKHTSENFTRSRLGFRQGRR
jgi:ATPase family associated with various cellular activities (AAA)